MTFAEFKVWLDGFAEAIGDAPTPEQWAKVREKMAQVYEAAPSYPPAVVPSPYPGSPSIPASPWWQSPITFSVKTETGAQSWN